METVHPNYVKSRRPHGWSPVSRRGPAPLWDNRGQIFRSPYRTVGVSGLIIKGADATAFEASYSYIAEVMGVLVSLSPGPRIPHSLRHSYCQSPSATAQNIVTIELFDFTSKVVVLRQTARYRTARVICATTIVGYWHAIG